MFHPRENPLLIQSQQIVTLPVRLSAELANPSGGSLFEASSFPPKRVWITDVLVIESQGMKTWLGSLLSKLAENSARQSRKYSIIHPLGSCAEGRLAIRKCCC